MSWYYIQSGNQCGPVADEELAGKVRSGELRSTDLIWQEGMTDWMPVSQVPQFSGLGVSVSAPLTTNPTFAQPAPPAVNPMSYQKIPNYLWQSIAVTVLCCVPFGIVAIVFAAKVDGLVARGDLAGAQAASKSAKTWVNVSVGAWVVIFVIYMALFAFGAISQNIQ